MASVNVQKIINAPAVKVWSIISEFGGVMKILDPRQVKSVECEGNDVGAVRNIMMADGSVIPERIEWKNEESMRLIYSIVGETVLPVREYVATAKVTVIDENTCQLDWQSTFRPVGSSEEAQKTIKNLYTGGISKLIDLLAS